MPEKDLEIKVLADRGGGYVAYALKNGKIIYAASDIDDPQAALKELALRMFMRLQRITNEVKA